MEKQKGSTLLQRLGNGLDDEKYIESWNKTMNMLGITMPLKELEKIYREFSEKMEEVIKTKESSQQDKR